MDWRRKDLLGLRELEREEIELILDNAESFREILTRPVKKVPALRGKTIVNLFFEPSTRTRTSFELAEKMMSADVVNISASSSSVVKGETLKDTARNLRALKADVIVLRHPFPGGPYLLANSLDCSIINAGDGAHEHPTQALLDMLTLREVKGRIEGLRIAIVGDISHSRVARSNIWGLTKLGARVCLVGPPTLIPPKVEEMGVEVYYNLDEVIPKVDVLMALRIQLERQKKGLFPSIREYRALYGITRERLKRAKKELLIMHPGPVNRGIELDPDVADGPHSVILDQVTNGLAVRMAVLYLCANFAG